MNIPQVNFSYITPDSTYFDQVIDLRYKTFYEPFLWEKGKVWDEQEESSLHLIASKNGNVLGYLRITLTNDLAEISQMTVESSSRKKGLGRELITHALEKIKSFGFSKVILNSRLNALKFYEKMGFKAIGDVFSNQKTGLLHMRMEKQVD